MEVLFSRSSGSGRTTEGLPGRLHCCSIMTPSPAQIAFTSTRTTASSWQEVGILVIVLRIVTGFAMACAAWYPLDGIDLTVITYGCVAAWRFRFPVYLSH